MSLKTNRLSNKKELNKWNIKNSHYKEYFEFEVDFFQKTTSQHLTQIKLEFGMLML